MKSGATAGRVAGTVVSRTERRTKTGNKMGIFGLSDPTGHFEAIIFSEGLAEYRDLLEPGTRGAAVLSAEVQGDEVRCPHPVGRAARSAAANCRRACASSCATARRSRRWPSGSTGAAARDRGDGEVSMILMLAQGAEVEVKLPGRFKVSPQIAGAIKAVPGVVTVEAL